MIASLFSVLFLVLPLDQELAAAESMAHEASHSPTAAVLAQDPAKSGAAKQNEAGQLGQGAQKAVPDLPPLPPGLNSRYVELAEFESWAMDALPEGVAKVTVLLPLLRADPVSSSTSVQRTFDNPTDPKMQSVGSSHAVFITGSPVVVLEAVKRLRDLDKLTPEPRQRSRNPAAALDGTEGLDAFQPQEGMAKGIGFLIAGLIGLGLAAMVFLRRVMR